MSFWGAAMLSGALFTAGLAATLRSRAAQARPLGVILMLNGALLMAVAAAQDLGALDGQALALLVLGVLSAAVALWAERQGAQ